MKALLTGASGTVGSALRAHLTARGHSVAAWDRQRVPIDDDGAMEAFVRAEAPDALFHLATASQSTGRAGESWLVNYEWTSKLARLCRTLGVRFVFTSSVMVFTDNAPGPFTPDSVPDAAEGYGYEKRRAEVRALEQNPDALVVRLGWQIGDVAGSNNMLDYLTTQARQHGQIAASTRWYPACSFLADTAAALTRLAWDTPGARGLYLLDSNPRWTFYEIVLALKALHGADWRVVPNEAFVYDQRMMDARTGMPPLSARLPSLAT